MGGWGNLPFLPTKLVTPILGAANKGVVGFEMIRDNVYHVLYPF